MSIEPNNARRNLSMADWPTLLAVDATSGESMFLVAEFSAPGDAMVRRFAAKRTASGGVVSVAYLGALEADGECPAARDVLVENFTVPGFMLQLRVMHMLYRMRRGKTRIMDLDGLTVAEADTAMKTGGWRTVEWPGDFQKFSNNRNDGRNQDGESSLYRG